MEKQYRIVIPILAVSCLLVSMTGNSGTKAAHASFNVSPAMPCASIAAECEKTAAEIINNYITNSIDEAAPLKEAKAAIYEEEAARLRERGDRVRSTQMAASITPIEEMKQASSAPADDAPILLKSADINGDQVLFFIEEGEMRIWKNENASKERKALRINNRAIENEDEDAETSDEEAVDEEYYGDEEEYYPDEEDEYYADDEEEYYSDEEYYEEEDSTEESEYEDENSLEQDAEESDDGDYEDEYSDEESETSQEESEESSDYEDVNESSESEDVADSESASEESSSSETENNANDETPAEESTESEAQPEEPASEPVEETQQQSDDTTQAPAEEESETEDNYDYDVAPGGEYYYDYASEIFEMTNNLRARLGIAPLSWSSSLASFAETRAREITVTFSHYRLDGLHYSAYGPAHENLAWGYPTTEDVFDGWYTSYDHYNNLTDASMSEVGIACYRYNGVMYWVMSFW